MKTLTAKDAKYGFGRLIDLARAEPVAVAKGGGLNCLGVPGLLRAASRPRECIRSLLSERV